MAITALPTPPSTSSPSTFAAQADALLSALPAFVTEANALETNVNSKEASAVSAASTATTKAGEASADADAAAASALLAQGAVTTNAGWSATSSTSMVVGTGSKTLTIQTGKQFIAGTDIRVSRTSDAANTYVYAKVSAYNTGTGQLDFTVATGDATGSGTFTDWTVSLSGSKGATGAAGAAGLSGAWIYLSTVTASNSASVDVDTTIDGTYDTYVIEAVNVLVATVTDKLWCRLKLGGSYIAGDYSSHVMGPTPSSTSYVAYVYDGQTDLQVTGPLYNTVGFGGCNLTMVIKNPASTTSKKHLYWQGAAMGGGANPVYIAGSGYCNNSTSALTGIRFKASSGNITSGTFRLYGIKNS